MTAEPSHIDAVITWVDGDDPAHRAKRLAAQRGALSAQADAQQIAAGRDDSRFLDNGELRYCLASLQCFAPWLRRIHIITDNQRPTFLQELPGLQHKISIVDHAEVFRGYEWALPTFNSRTIETVMWRIPDLAAKFIYLNDDFVLTRPQSPDQFFDGERVVLQGHWKRLREYGAAELALNRAINLVAKKLFGVTRTMHLLAQMRGALLAGKQGSYLRTPHVPHPLRRDTLADFFATNPQALEDNIRFAFRDTAQYLAVALADHLEIGRDNAICTEPGPAAIISGEYRSINAMRDTIAAIGRGELDFLCLGSVEKLDEETGRLLERCLRDLLEPGA